jgi:hypothetical protein
MYDEHPGRRRLVTIPSNEITSQNNKLAAPTKQDTSDIDELMKRGLLNISRMMSVISEQASSGVFDRESIQNLKDLMSMLNDLKKREQDLLDSLTDSQLEELSDTSK